MILVTFVTGILLTVNQLNTVMAERDLPCLDIVQPDNGVRTPYKMYHMIDEQVTFQCNVDFTLIGKTVLTCQSNGTWNGHHPLCLASCSDPGVPNNGARLGDSFRHGQTVRFGCKKNHKLKGSSFLTCVNGKWNDVSPTCISTVGWFSGSFFGKTTCKDPGNPDNGERIPYKKKYLYKDEITFHCASKRYKMAGKSVLSCKKDGTWDGYKPLCLAMCFDPGVPAHGVRLGNDFKHGQTVRFRCKRGYKLKGPFFLTCVNGKWNDRRPNCTASCSDPGIPLHGKRLGNSFHHRDVVRFACDNGFKMDGSASIKCKDGQWDHNAPRCFASCGDPGVPSHGICSTSADFNHGSIVRFRCKKGYTLEGPSFTHCSNGRWNNKTPKCAAPCPDPGIPTGGERLNSSFYHNDEVKYLCISGWKMDGVDTIRCNDGQWDHNAPKCLPRFEILGCFKILESTAGPLFIRVENFRSDDYNTSNSKNFNFTISACAWAASSMFFEVFGIQENGECWGFKDNTKSYSQGGSSTDCHHGVGKRRSVMVYKLRRAICFPANAVLRLKTGVIVTMETLKIGDEIQTLDKSTNEVIYTEVITFLHIEKSQGLYRVIETENGHKLLISHEHLIYTGKTKDILDMIYAEKIQIGDFILSENKTSRVVNLTTVYGRGLYAPMTRHGTMLVNGIYVSCYAHYSPHTMVHRLMAPLRLWYDLSNFVKNVVASRIGMKSAVAHGLTSEEILQGLHGYIRFLFRLSDQLPKRIPLLLFQNINI